MQAQLVDVVGSDSTQSDVAWSTLDTLIATVDEGLVTARGNGNTQLIAVSSGLQDTVQVFVNQMAASIDIDRDRFVFLELHEYQQVRATVRDSGGTTVEVGSVTWTSTDAGALRVPTRCGGNAHLAYPCARAIRSDTATLIARYDGVADSVPATIAVARRIRLISKSFYFYETPGATFQIEAEVTDRRRNVIQHAPITYDFPFDGVAVVDSGGLVTVVGHGDALITLRAGSARATVHVSVFSPATSIEIEPDTIHLPARGASATFAAVATTAAGDRYSLGEHLPFSRESPEWSSTDTSVVAVNAVGLVTARDEGSASIVATYLEDTTTLVDTALVVVSYLDEIEIRPSGDIHLSRIGDTTRVRAVGTGLAVSLAVGWSSGDTTIATVDESGLITAVGFGTTSIVAETGHLRAQRSVIVRERLPPTDGIEPQSLTLYRPLLRQQLKLRLFDGFTEITPKSVEWSVKDTLVAIIDRNGLLTSRRKGQTEVVAVADGKTYTANVEAFDPERDMLMELYHALDGPNWTRNGNWGTDQLIYEYPGWEGVTPWLVARTEQLAPTGAKFFASLDRRSHVARVVDGLSITDQKAALLDAVDRVFANDEDRLLDSLSAFHEGRVYALEFGRNEMRGTLPSRFFNTLSALTAIDMRQNEVRGSLEEMNELELATVVILESNRFSGPLPVIDFPTLIIFGVNGNALSGTPVIASPVLTRFSLSQNEFTGAFDITQNPSLIGADWSNTKSLCTNGGASLEAWVEAAVGREFGLGLHGPICNDQDEFVVGAPFAVQVQSRRPGRFTAAMDSIELDVRFVDLAGARISTAVDTPLVWTVISAAAPGADSVVRVVSHPKADGDTAFFVQSKWTGVAEVRVGIKNHFIRSVDTLFLTSPIVDTLVRRDSTAIFTSLPITVEQTVASLDVPSVSVAANTFGAWSYIGRDRNDQPAYVIPPVGVSSSDTSVVKALRNGVLQAGSSAGTSSIVVTQQDGIVGSGTVTVIANTASATAPSIDSMRNTMVSPGTEVVLRGSALDSTTRVGIDGAFLPLSSPPWLPAGGCGWYEYTDGLYTPFGFTVPDCPNPEPTPLEACSAIYDWIITAFTAAYDATTAQTFANGVAPYCRPFTVQTADSVKFTIPDFGRFQCTADRNIALVLMNDAGEGDAISVPFELPGKEVPADLAVGGVFAVDSLSPGAGVRVEAKPICLEFPRSSTEKDYVITVSATAHPDSVDLLRVSDLNDAFRLTARVSADDGLAGAVAEGMVAGTGSEIPTDFQEGSVIIEDHRRAKEELRRRERSAAANHRPGLAESRAGPKYGVDSTTAVGDTVKLFHGFGSCSADNTVVTGVVRNIGTHVVMVADIANRNDYTDEDYTWFTDILDKDILPVLIDYFGEFSDVNGDERVAVLFTDEVGNAVPGLLGWVTVLDMLDKAHCAGSNHMEIFYGRTPDEDLDRERMLEIVPPLIAHELTHVQQGRAAVGTTGIEEALNVFLEIWVAEGQATYAEEIVGFAIQGLSEGRNYGPDKLEGQREAYGEWFVDLFSDLGSYLHERVSFRDGVSGTGPCSWWRAQSDPCSGRSLWYGVSWSFWRFIVDQFGSNITGGGKGFHQRMIDKGEVDIWSFIETETGTPERDVLSAWNAMFYLDDHSDYDLPTYQMTSWKVKEAVESLVEFVTIGPIPRIVPGSNVTLPDRNMRLSSGLRYLIDTSGAHEERNIFFELKYDPGYVRSVPVLFPIRVIRVK
ncbi:hypothetical protein [Candidatus Palauibacter sp.]|uniref:hypothetical protein n=1 Tax=Candidatus Palauibacter sp. TaxID=3101350 RepID=UPI003B024BDE